jgi:hypothetical protein
MHLKAKKRAREMRDLCSVSTAAARESVSTIL